MSAVRGAGRGVREPRHRQPLPLPPQPHLWHRWVQAGQHAGVEGGREGVCQRPLLSCRRLHRRHEVVARLLRHWRGASCGGAHEGRAVVVGIHIKAILLWQAGDLACRVVARQRRLGGRVALLGSAQRLQHARLHTGVCQQAPTGTRHGAAAAHQVLLAVAQPQACHDVLQRLSTACRRGILQPLAASGAAAQLRRYGAQQG